MPGVAPFVPLIATGASMAYDTFVSQPGREKAMGDASKIQWDMLNAQQKQWAEQKLRIDRDFDWRKGIYEEEKKKAEALEAQRQEYIKKYEDMLKGWDSSAIVKAKMDIVKGDVDKQMAAQRPQVLQNLSARGVRTSGVSEYPLIQLEKQKTDTLARATATATIEDALAKRAAETGFLSTMIGQRPGSVTPPALPSYPGAPDTSGYAGALTNQAMLPIYQNSIMSNMLQYAGMGAGYAMNNWPTSSGTYNGTMDPLTQSVMGYAGYGKGPLDLAYVDKKSGGLFTGMN